MLDTINLREINDRLAPLKLSAEIISDLGIEPVGKERAAVLYRASDFSAICYAIVRVAGSAKIGNA